MIIVMLKSSLMILSAAVAVVFLRRQSAAIRHLVWAVGLIAALGVPLSSVLMPAWDLPIEESLRDLVGSPPAGSGTVTTGGAERAFKGANTDRPPWNLTGWAVGVWVAGASIGLLIIFLGSAHLGWIAFRAKPFADPCWDAGVVGVRRKLHLRRRVRLLQTNSASLIGTYGVVTHHVLLPRHAEDWPESRIRMVLAHELAHARRRDWLFQILAEAARAIYWFNPLFWLSARKLRVESEQAADDVVLRLGTVGADYAKELVGLTRSLRDGKRELLPVLGMAQAPHIQNRLVAVLDPSLKRLAATPWSIVVVVLAAVGLTLPLAAVRTQPVTSATVAPPDAATGVTSTADGTESVEPDPGIQPNAGPPAGNAVSDLPRATCAVTRTVSSPPPEAERVVAQLGSGPWYVSQDQRIWVWDQPWSAGDAIQTVWVRPPGERLVLTARLLDPDAGASELGDEPEMDARVTRSGDLFFKTSMLRFSDAGCWEVTAKAGDTEFVFVTEVGP